MRVGTAGAGPGNITQHMPSSKNPPSIHACIVDYSSFKSLLLMWHRSFTATLILSIGCSYSYFLSNLLPVLATKKKNGGPTYCRPRTVLPLNPATPPVASPSLLAHKLIRSLVLCFHSVYIYTPPHKCHLFIISFIPSRSQMPKDPKIHVLKPIFRNHRKNSHLRRSPLMLSPDHA